MTLVFLSIHTLAVEDIQRVALVVVVGRRATAWTILEVKEVFIMIVLFYVLTICRQGFDGRREGKISKLWLFAFSFLFLESFAKYIPKQL